MAHVRLFTESKHGKFTPNVLRRKSGWTASCVYAVLRAIDVQEAHTGRDCAHLQASNRTRATTSAKILFSQLEVDKTYTGAPNEKQ